MTAVNPIKPLNIGGLKLKNNLALAPMAGITNFSFRLLSAEGGAGLVVTEMISAESIKYGNKKSFAMLNLSPDENAAVQIFGSDSATMALAALKAQEYGAKIIDINAGCPVKKILRSGSGAALMKTPVLFGNIISSVVKAVKVPVTVKFRVGLNYGENIGPLLIRIAEESGASAVTLHGRYASNFHTGPVDLNAMAETLKTVKIPVYGNGGVSDVDSAKAMFDIGCSGVAIGRAAVYNPGVFKEIIAKLSGDDFYVDTKDRIKLFLRFLQLNSEIYGESNGLMRARKLVGYWLKKIPDATTVRDKFMAITTLKEAEDLLKEYIK